MQRIIVVAVVTILLATSLASVTTATAQTTAPPPGQCEWPVAGNAVMDGLFVTGDGWTLGGGGEMIAIASHPCGYETAWTGLEASGGAYANNINYSNGQFIRYSFWHRGEGFNVYYQLDNAGGYGGLYAEAGPVADWQFFTSCQPVENVTSGNTVTFLRISEGDLTGVSVLVGDTCEAEPTPTPTTEATAVPTAVPTATPTPGPTATPFASRMVTATYALDLPALPPPIDYASYGTGDYDIAIAFDLSDFAFIISVVRTVPRMLADRPFWAYVIWFTLVLFGFKVIGSVIFTSRGEEDNSPPPQQNRSK